MSGVRAKETAWLSSAELCSSGILRHDLFIMRAFGVGALGSLSVLALWMILAAVNLTTNYHFAPLIAVLAAPVSARMAHAGRLRPPDFPARWPEGREPTLTQGSERQVALMLKNLFGRRMEYDHGQAAPRAG